MLCSVVINNYNYEQYLAEAIGSVLDQTFGDVKLIIVDDGSTDGSATLAEKYLSDRVLLVRKENGGQLSCFNAALPYLEGDYVFFLDSDDLYDREYISRAVEYYRQNSMCDFLFCKPRLIDREGNSLDQVTRKTPYHKEHYGYTAAITWATHRWIGAPTSCISMKRSLLEKILPIPYESDWITRADDCLIWGASLKGGYKCRLIEPLVNYRIHGQNYFQGREIPPHKRYLWELARNRVFQFLSEDLDTSRMAELLRFEFAALPELARGDLEHYLKAIRDSSMSLRQKLRHSRKVISHYFRNRSNKRPSV